MRLRTRLFLLVLVCVVPLLGANLALTYIDYRESGAAVEERLLLQARTIALALEREQQRHITGLQTLALSRSLRNGDWAGFRVPTEEYLSHQPLGARIGLTDGNGQVLMMVGAVPPPGTPLPRRNAVEVIQQVFATQRPVVSDFYLSKIGTHHGFSVDVPVMQDGRVIYDLFLMLPASSLTDFITAEHIPTDAVAGVIDSAGILVAGFPSEPDRVGKPVSPDLRALLAAGRNSTATVSGADDKPALTALARTTKSGWGVFVLLPQESLTAMLRSDITRTLAAGLVTTLAALLLAGLAASRIARPIAALTRQIASPHAPAGARAAPVRTGLPEADEVAAALAAAEHARETAAVARAELEARFRSLFDNAPCGTILIDPDTLGIVDCNAPAARTSGLAPEDMKQRRLTELYVLPAAPDLIRLCRTVADGEPQGFSARLVGPDGQRELTVAAAPLTVAGRTVVLASQIDVTDLRKAEANARRIDERLRLATDAAELGTWRRNLKTGATTCSPQWRILMGLGPAERLSFGRILNAIHADDRAAVIAAMRAAEAHDGVLEIDFRVVGPEGSIRWLRSKGRAERDPITGEAVAMQGILLAVDKEKNAAALLAASEERLSLALEGADCGIWDWDIRTGRLTWTEREWSLHGIPPAGDGPSFEIWRNCVHPDDRRRMRELGTKVLADASASYDVEYRVILPDGTTRWLVGRAKVVRDADGNALRMVGVNADITARKHAEDALRETASQLRLTHQIAGTGSFEWTVDDADARISDHYALICGLPEGTVREPWRHAQARVHPDDRAALAALVQQVIAGAISGYTTTFRILRTDTRAIRYVASRAELMTRDNKPCIVGIIRDITDEREAQEALRRLNRNLEARVAQEIAARESAQRRAAQAERMQALGQIAGGIAHDFNNVLQAVTGGAALIERRAADPDGVRRYVRMVADAARRGAAITSRLLAFARRGDLRAEPVDAGGLLTDLAEVLNHTLGGAVRCQTQIVPRLPPLLADRGQLETVLVNLATNARDAMPAGGNLTMRAYAETVRQGDRHPAGLAPGAYVAISLCDTGIGMPPEVLARAADPFLTTKDVGKGTGLGLAMAKGFAEQSLGGLGIASEVEQGTTVTLWLPQADVQMPVRQDGEEDADRKGDSKVRVLLVDDDPIVREVLTAALADAGYAVTPATGGMPALKILAGDPRIDILVTDLTMPGLDGLELIRETHKKRPGLPAILLTGYAGDGAALAVGGAISGTFSLLRKPVSGSQLADRISALLVSEPASRA